MTQTAAAASTTGVDASLMMHIEPGVPTGRIAEQPAREKQKADESEQEKVSPKERDAIMKQLNKTLEAFDTHVSLSLDEKSHQTIIKVVDNETGKVVRQIPNEQLMRISERINELLGVIYDEKM
jgi:flagellar protein FlaG